MQDSVNDQQQHIRNPLVCLPDRICTRGVAFMFSIAVFSITIQIYTTKSIYLVYFIKIDDI